MSCNSNVSCEGLANKNDNEIIDECERELQQMIDWNADLGQSEQENAKRIIEKRQRGSSEESGDDGFTVVKRRPKKLLRSEAETPRGEVDNINLCDDEQHAYEVCATSLEILPKQMAFAKLLRSENIKNVIRIRYKSPYKIFVQFDDRQEAENFLGNKHMQEMGIRTQYTEQARLSYGIIKGVDIEMEEKDILDSLECPIEIISIKRLKRMDKNGKWIESETIRLCFKDATCPTFVYAYGCRFRVDAFVFPVSQCSVCWKFGHFKRFCPSNKALCPKCGQAHDNCDTKEFKCLNCKGPHISFDKTCPMFLKEKAIRQIMSKKSLTYKRALEHFLKEQKATEAVRNSDFSNSFPLLTPTRDAASHNVDPNVGNDEMNISKKQPIEEEEEEKRETFIWKRDSKRNVKNKKREGNRSEMPMDEEFMGQSSTTDQNKTEDEINKKKIEWKFQWRKIFEKIKSVVFAENNMNLEDKIMSVIRVICLEIKSYISSIFCSRDFMQKILSI